MIIGIDASRANSASLSGTERYAYEVIRRLPTRLPSVTVRLYVRESLHPRWGKLPPNVEVRVLSWPPRRLWSQIRLVIETFLHRPDLIFFPSSAIPWMVPCPVLTTIHDVAFERFPELYRPSELRFQRWAIRRALRVARKILTVSDFTRQEIIQLYPSPHPPIEVCHLGLDHVVPPTTGNPATIENQDDPKRPYMLFLGRLETKKNIDNILRGYMAYRKRTTSPLDLVLAGPPGFGWPEAKGLVPDNLFGDCIHLVGWVEDVRKLNLERHAEMMIFISRYEGFGIPPLESMQLGVPVIAAKASAMPEVLRDAPVYVDPNDIASIGESMFRLSTDQALRSTCIKRGFEVAATYTWDRTADRTARALASVNDLKTPEKNGTVKAA